MPRGSAGLSQDDLRVLPPPSSPDTLLDYLMRLAQEATARRRERFAALRTETAIHAWQAARPSGGPWPSILKDRSGVGRGRPHLPLFGQVPAARSAGHLSAGVPGREAYNRVDAWSVSPTGALFGGTSDGYLFRLDPAKGEAFNLGKPLNQYRIRGLAWACGKFHGSGRRRRRNGPPLRPRSAARRVRFARHGGRESPPAGLRPRVRAAVRKRLALTDFAARQGPVAETRVWKTSAPWSWSRRMTSSLCARSYCWRAFTESPPARTIKV